MDSLYRPRMSQVDRFLGTGRFEIVGRVLFGLPSGSPII
jgi:hypothetical protein